jgi:hypothetical protein
MKTFHEIRNPARFGAPLKSPTHSLEPMSAQAGTDPLDR